MISAPPQAIEAPVLRLVDCFNRRDLEGMLALLDPKVVVHPLRFPGVEDSYECHDGVREWMSKIAREGHRHRIEADGARRVLGGRVLIVGTVTVGTVEAPFSGVHDIGGGMVTFAHHYFTPAEVLERLGVLDRSESSLQSPEPGTGSRS